eukprot:TRINITY_DN1947_c0_g1_i6.p1 TRINITY_DN1947_c0_g1~~TRINITY_DN1947_c0_g1_i6.p1  ORF type:complete len:126 (+),score=31.44 TRINITY_DN1947_c0_g1_i6:439-816(+)
MYCRGTSGAIVVFDFANHDSFKSCRQIVAGLRKSAPSNVVICLAGNKQDLASSEQDVSQEEIDAFVAELKLTFFMEVSAAMGVNVVELFGKLIAAVLEQKKTEEPQQEPFVLASPPSQPTNKCRC